MPVSLKTQVDAFVKWFTDELQKNAQRNNAAITSCNLAAERCRESADKFSAPVDKTIERLRAIERQGEEVISRAEQRLTKAYQCLRESVLNRVTAVLVVSAVLLVSFAVLVMWGTRRAIDTNWQEMAEHSERQT